MVSNDATMFGRSAAEIGAALWPGDWDGAAVTLVDYEQLGLRRHARRSASPASQTSPGCCSTSSASA